MMRIEKVKSMWWRWEEEIPKSSDGKIYILKMRGSKNLEGIRIRSFPFIFYLWGVWLREE